MRVLGIDEAGRGCVLGPLVVAGFLAEGVSDEALRGAGARDSKAITHVKRVAAREKLVALGSPDVRPILATEIDEENLNALEERIVVDLVQRWQPDLVIIDALGHPRTIPALIERLKGRVGGPPCRWVMEPKADGTYPTCGAASIFAKTHRDAALEPLRAEFGDFGSGYPSDEVTRKWLVDWSASRKPWPPFVRTRWETVRALEQVRLFSS